MAAEGLRDCVLLWEISQIGEMCNRPDYTLSLSLCVCVCVCVYSLCVWSGSPILRRREPFPSCTSVVF